MLDNQTLQDKYPHLEVSVLKLSEVKKDNESFRIDSEYLRQEYLYLKNILLQKPYEYLSQLVSYNSRYSQPIYDDKSKMKVINSQYIRNEFIDYENAKTGYGKVVPKESVLINSTGIRTLGRVNINLLDFDFSIDSHINVLVIKDRAILNPYFLMIFLQTKYGQSQINRYYSGTSGQIEIYPKDFNYFIIPIFPMPFQLEIEKLVKDSHKVLESSKALYKEAEALLYEALGLDSKNPLQSILNTHCESSLCHCEGVCSTTEKSKSPKSTHQDISCIRPQYDKASPNYTIRTLAQSFKISGRLDAEYYQAKYEKNEALLKSLPHKRLHELVDIYKSIEPGSNFYKEKGLPFVRVSNLSKFGVGKSEVYLDSKDFVKESLQSLYPKKDDVLLSKDGSVGIAYAVENDLECVLSGAILRLKIKDKVEIKAKYLSSVLNSITTQLQAQRDCGGSIIAHWRLEEIQNLLIPLLDSKTQEKIESKISQSFELRAEAKNLLESAKQRVENAIHENQ